MKNLLNVKELSLSFGANVIFDGIGFGIADGECVAVVGPNGQGKSTLFRILAGELIPDEGTVAYRGDSTVAYLAQEVSFSPGDIPREIVAEALRPLQKAIENYEKVSEEIGEAAARGEDLEELLERQTELHDRIRKFGGWEWEHRVEDLLDRLGVSSWIDTPVGRLSGGQRRRVDLARVLLQSPDLLLLDEPTNHLDTDTVEWLEGWLQSRGNTVLIITHDRYFLERVARRILEIDEEGIFDHPGNYEVFMERKLHRMEIRKRTEERREKLLKKELEWLSGGIKSQNTRSQKRINKIEEMQQEGRAYEERRLDMEIPNGGELGPTILAARGIDKSFGDHTLLENASFGLILGDRIGLIGPNGCGKTTLLKMLVGEETYDAGNIEVGKKTEIAFMRQHGLPTEPKATVFEALGESDYVWVGDSRYHKIDYLKRFLFDENLQKTQVRMLSGGQRRRLALAELVARNANVLILDEPTNDLDMLSLEALESALQDYEGCVVAVSHDRFFLNRICNAIVAFEDKKLVRYEGNYDVYRQKRPAPADPPVVEQDSKPKPQLDKCDGGDSDGSGGLTWKQRLRLEELEEKIASGEERRDEVERKLADPTLYTERKEKIEPLNRELRRLERELETLYEEWSTLEEAL